VNAKKLAHDFRREPAGLRAREGRLAFVCGKSALAGAEQTLRPIPRYALEGHQPQDECVIKVLRRPPEVTSFGFHTLEFPTEVTDMLRLRSRLGCFRGMKRNHAPFLRFPHVRLREAPVIRDFLPIDGASSLQSPGNDCGVAVHPDSNV